MVKDFNFTEDTIKEIAGLAIDKENAFDLLIKNYKSEGITDLTSNDIVSRLQTQYYITDSTIGDLRTEEDWEQKEYFEPNEVNNKVAQVTSGKYSSFALLKNEDNFQLTFPLYEDYLSLFGPFETSTMPDVYFATNFRNLSEKLGVVVKQNNFYKYSVYTRGMLKRAIIKIKNKALTLLKKPIKTIGLFKGTISLRTKIGDYKISNIEKLTKVYDFILGVAVKAESKKHKNELGKSAKQIEFMSRIFADILMARLNDLGDINNNKKLEKCLWLQFANALNKYNLDASQLKMVTELGTKATVKVCRQLGITKEKIIAKMTQLGYIYTCVPADETTALIGIKERDYSVYNVVNAQKQTIKEEPTAMHFASSAKLDVKTDEVKEEPIKTEPQKEQIADEDSSQSYDSKYSEKSIIPSNGIKKTVKKASTEKKIDNIVVKFLAEQATRLADKIGSGKLKNKKLLVAESECNLYKLMLAYYVQASKSKPMSIKNDFKYTENEISKAKLIVKSLIAKRSELVELAMANGQFYTQNKTLNSYLNKICESISGLTVKGYFTKIIKGCVSYCVSAQFATDKQQTKQEQDQQIMAYLDSVGKDIDDKGEEFEKTDYVPNFVVVDDGTSTKKTDYVPNFVFVDNEQTK